VKFQQWRRSRGVTLSLTHVPGDRLFVDYAGNQEETIMRRIADMRQKISEFAKNSFALFWHASAGAPGDSHANPGTMRRSI
jgi:hypothetical protein